MAIRINDRRLIYQIYSYRCYYCGQDYSASAGHPGLKRLLQIDHLTARTKGGQDSFWNYVPACRTCNIQKGNKSVDEFRQTRTAYLLKLIDSALSGEGYIDEYLRSAESPASSEQRLAALLIDRGLVGAVRSGEWRFSFPGEAIRQQAIKAGVCVSV